MDRLCQSNAGPGNHSSQQLIAQCWLRLHGRSGHASRMSSCSLLPCHYRIGVGELPLSSPYHTYLSPSLRWRDNLRIWLAAAVVQPLSALLDANATDVTAAAAKGISVATAPAGSTSSLFGGCGGSSLFATPSMAAPPPAASGAPVSVSQWLAHTHTDASAKALAHQHTKLHRFLQVTGYGVDTKPYVRARISELARGHCLGEYKWDRGGGGWHEKLPTDAEIIVHLFKVRGHVARLSAWTPSDTRPAPHAQSSTPLNVHPDLPRFRCRSKTRFDVCRACAIGLLAL
mgnify:CR=1 FL=1